jgi:hypothetical protein
VWSSKVLTLSLSLSMGMSMIMIARGNSLWWLLRGTELAFWHLTYDGRCNNLWLSLGRTELTFRHLASDRRCNWLRNPLLTERRGSYLRARSDGRLIMLRLRWIWKLGV